MFCQLKLCKVSEHIGIKGNEEADKAAKHAIGLPEMTTTRHHHTDYYLSIERDRNSSGMLCDRTSKFNH